MTYIEVKLATNCRAIIVIEHIVAISELPTDRGERCYIWVGGGDDDSFLCDEPMDDVLQRMNRPSSL